MGIGVVYEDYNTDQMPGFWKSTVGYHIDDRRIFDYEFEQKKKFKKTTLTGICYTESSTKTELFGVMHMRRDETRREETR